MAWHEGPSPVISSNADDVMIGQPRAIISSTTKRVEITPRTAQLPAAAETRPPVEIVAYLQVLMRLTQLSLNFASGGALQVNKATTT